ncbi:MAG TPA: hypothetical protein VGH13_20490 [Xanthobacteraceae bacterium]
MIAAVPSGPPPVLREMFRLLPVPHSVFPLEKRLEWFRAFINAAGFCYGFSGDEIDIVTEGDQIRFMPRPRHEIDADWSE